MNWIIAGVWVVALLALGAAALLSPMPEVDLDAEADKVELEESTRKRHLEMQAWADRHNPDLSDPRRVAEILQELRTERTVWYGPHV